METNPTGMCHLITPKGRSGAHTLLLARLYVIRAKRDRGTKLVQSNINQINNCIPETCPRCISGPSRVVDCGSVIADIEESDASPPATNGDVQWPQTTKSLLHLLSPPSLVWACGICMFRFAVVWVQLHTSTPTNVSCGGQEVEIHILAKRIHGTRPLIYLQHHR